MNWTGGTLQRTKNANKGTKTVQKAYFAKARTNLQNGSHSPVAPFRPSYLQNDDSFELAGHLPTFGSGSVRHTGHSARRRREFTNGEPSPDHATHASVPYSKAFPGYVAPEASHRFASTTKPPEGKRECASSQLLLLWHENSREY